MIIGFLAAAAVGQLSFSCDQQTTSELVACALQQYRVSDGALNKQWKAMAHGPALLRAQRAWLAYRDAECEVENPATPEGREYPVYKYLCLARLNAERVDLLREVANR